MRSETVVLKRATCNVIVCNKWMKYGKDLRWLLQNKASLDY